MRTKIPSPVLARIQLMFQSGATLDEVADALDLDTAWQDESQPAPAAAPQPVATPQPANDTRSPRLTDLSTKMEDHVARLLERDDVRDLPALAGALDSIYQYASAIQNEIKSTSRVKEASVSTAQPATTATTAPKKVAPKSSKKKASAAPPPIKVQPPKKKKQAEKLKPTGELPAVGRRKLVHPLQAKPLAQPQSTKPQSVSSPSHPNDEYRDRIALAMSQISTFDDDHERDEDRLTARN